MRCCTKTKEERFHSDWSRKWTTPWPRIKQIPEQWSLCSPVMPKQLPPVPARPTWCPGIALPLQLSWPFCRCWSCSPSDRSSLWKAWPPPVFRVFMDIAQARNLLGTETDYFNMVLSERALDISSGIQLCSHDVCLLLLCGERPQACRDDRCGVCLHLCRNHYSGVFCPGHITTDNFLANIPL